MRGAWTVCRKELVDHLRDRRSVLSALLFPVTGPALLALLFSLMISWQQADTPLQVAVHGAERAPHLVSFLRRYGAQVETTPADFVPARWTWRLRCHRTSRPNGPRGFRPVWSS